MEGGWPIDIYIWICGFDYELNDETGQTRGGTLTLLILYCFLFWIIWPGMESKLINELVEKILSFI